MTIDGFDRLGVTPASDSLSAPHTRVLSPAEPATPEPIDPAQLGRNRSSLTPNRASKLKSNRIDRASRAEKVRSGAARYGL